MSSALHEGMEIYFAAKARMFAREPAFRVLRVGPLTCFHKHPGWPEVEGFYAVDGETPPEAVMAAMHAYQPDREHLLTVFTDAPASLQHSYDEWGYRPLPDPQPFLSKSLAAQSTDQSGKDAVLVSRVETGADVDFINSGEMVMEPAHLNDPLYRYYYVRRDDQPVCWGRCVVVSPDAIYIAGMETASGYRRRGLATALMNRLHTDAAALEIKRSVLCSTVLGLGLYHKVGYESLGYMQAFVPDAPAAA